MVLIIFPNIFHRIITARCLQEQQAYCVNMQTVQDICYQWHIMIQNVSYDLNNCHFLLVFFAHAQAQIPQISYNIWELHLPFSLQTTEFNFQF